MSVCVRVRVNLSNNSNKKKSERERFINIERAKLCVYVIISVY